MNVQQQQEEKKNEEVYIDIKLAIMCIFYVTEIERYMKKGKNKTIDREQKVLFNARINKKLSNNKFQL